MFSGASVGLEFADVPLPIPSHAWRYRETALGIFDRGSKRAVEPEAPMRFEDSLPGIERARHGDGVDRVADLAPALGGQRLKRGLGAGAAGAVIAPDRLARLRDQAVAIAADAGHVRLAHAQRRYRRYRGIRRAAAGAQRVDSGQGRERMRGRRHAIAGDHGRAAGELEIAAHVCLRMFQETCSTPSTVRSRWAERSVTAKPPITSMKLMTSSRKKVALAACFTSRNSTSIPRNRISDSP